MAKNSPMTGDASQSTLIKESPQLRRHKKNNKNEPSHCLLLQYYIHNLLLFECLDIGYKTSMIMNNVSCCFVDQQESGRGHLETCAKKYQQFATS